MLNNYFISISVSGMHPKKEFWEKLLMSNKVNFFDSTIGQSAVNSVVTDSKMVLLLWQYKIVERDFIFEQSIFSHTTQQ